MSSLAGIRTTVFLFFLNRFSVCLFIHNTNDGAFCQK
jgi:hypothetical protein